MPRPDDFITLNLGRVLQAMRRKGYIVFEDPRGCDLNIVGIRHDSAVPESFDDDLHVFWRRGEGWEHLMAKCTTDPGLYYLERPMNVSGTAIIQPGQHRRCWTLGHHRIGTTGAYDALVQRGAPGVISVWRDRDRDRTLDLYSEDEESGRFALHLHRTDGKPPVERSVGRWSAGCVVAPDERVFDRLIEKAREQAAKLSPFFTFTLLEASELP